jgi:arylsulfatase A-like enzyme
MKQPNVLLILTDQQRKDSLGCYGGKGARTPNLDNLAKKGCLYNRCYVANPICTPTRTSIFTGLAPSAHGRFTNGLPFNTQPPTLTGVFKENGYQTANFRKVHFEPYEAPADKSNEAIAKWKQIGDNIDWTGPYYDYEHVELTLGHTHPLAHYGKWFHENGGTDDMLESKITGRMRDTGTSSVPPELHDSTFVAERTEWFLKEGRDKNKPFFTVASFPDPHHPFNPPEDIANLFDPEEMANAIESDDLESRPERYKQHFRGGWHRSGAIDESSPEGYTEKEIALRRAYTAAMVHLIDKSVGRIIKALDEEGLAEDTIVIFTTDHGELLGDHGLFYKGPFFYEPLVNVPLIMAGHGIEPCVSEELISSIDILPTVLGMCGISTPWWCRGVDINKVKESCKHIEYRSGFNEADVQHAVLVTDV